MNKEELLLRKRLIELSNVAYQRGIAMFTDFLNLNELNILHTTPKDMFAIPYMTFGGYDFAERQMVGFLPDAFSLYMEITDIHAMYPFDIIEITPVNDKFAENLTHRDYLGALLNLGIDRSKLGDLIISEHRAIVFVQEGLSDFIIEELTRVRHTTVCLKKVQLDTFQYEPKFEEIKGTVASIRLDALLSLAYNSSRSKLTALIEAGRVYVNGKLITTNAYQIKENDIVSVRQMGRFKYIGSSAMSRKGRTYVTIHKYI